MSPFPALDGLRIGCVQYLNSKPLIACYPGRVVFDHPAKLARALAGGTLDAALVPIFEALGSPNYRTVDGVAIAANGPVYSVFLAYTGELQKVRRIALDPASLTSAHLVQVLLREFHGLMPECTTASEAEPADARLLIGNQALAYRRLAIKGEKFLDLGEEWQRQTGLPFVFAVWLLRRGLANEAAAAREFRELKDRGVKRIPEIASREIEFGPELALRYLTEHISFELGPREKLGAERFRELLHKHGFLRGPAGKLDYL